jgi:hypothetical protein
LPITRREGGAVTSLLVLGAFVGVMVAMAGLLTLVCRRFLGGPPPAPRRPRRFRRRVLLPPEPSGTADGTRSRKVVRVRRVAGPVTHRRPVQEVAADLRRLARELAAVPAGAPFIRWQALQTAYDRVLTEATELLEVPHALGDLPMGTNRDIERLRVVCTLEAAGLVVQD